MKISNFNERLEANLDSFAITLIRWREGALGHELFQRKKGCRQ